MSSTTNALSRQSGVNEVDLKLLQLHVAGVSPEEMSRRLGGTVSPARIILRLRALATSPDWATAQERRQLDILAMREMLGELRTNFRDIDGAKAVLTIIREVMKQEDQLAAATQTDLNTYSANVGRQIGTVVDLALTYMKGALREEVDAAKWDELVVEAMVLAQTEIEKRQVEA